MQNKSMVLNRPFADQENKVKLDKDVEDLLK